jgi:hypothetical protein
MSDDTTLPVPQRRPPPHAPTLPDYDLAALSAASDEAASRLGLTVPPAAPSDRPELKSRPAAVSGQRDSTEQTRHFVRAAVPAELARALRIQAAIDDRLPGELVAEALRAYLSARGQTL